MVLKFTARQPKPRKAAVDPLTTLPEAKESADPTALPAEAAVKDAAPEEPAGEKTPKELGGPSGPEPTRYGDWERKGICVDF